MKKRIAGCFLLCSLSLLDWGCKPDLEPTTPMSKPDKELAIPGPTAINTSLGDSCKIKQTTYWMSVAMGSPTSKRVTFEDTSYQVIPYRLCTYTYDSIGRIQSKYDSTWINNDETNVSVWLSTYKYVDNEMIILDKTGPRYSEKLDADGYIVNSSSTKNEFDEHGNLIKTTAYNDNWVHTTTYLYDQSKANLPAVETYKQASKNLPVSYDFVMTDSANAKAHWIGKYAYEYDKSGHIVSQIKWTKTLKNSTIFLHTDGLILTEYQYKCR